MTGLAERGLTIATGFIPWEYVHHKSRVAERRLNSPGLVCFNRRSATAVDFGLLYHLKAVATVTGSLHDPSKRSPPAAGRNDPGTDGRWQRNFWRYGRRLCSSRFWPVLFGIINHLLGHVRFCLRRAGDCRLNLFHRYFQLDQQHQWLLNCPDYHQHL